MRKIITILLLLSVVFAFILTFTGCDAIIGIAEDIVLQPVHHDTVPAPLVTCDPAPVDTPAFIQGFVELDNPINVGGWVLNVGPYTDTVFAGQESLLAAKLALLINAFRPQYYTQAFTRPDARRISIMTKGTDSQATLNSYVWIRADGAKWYMAFARRGFYHGGAVDLPTWLALAIEFPDMTGFNLRDSGFGPQGENQAMVAVVDFCKLCDGCRADFRFNEVPPGDSIVAAFDTAHWNTITSFTGGDIEVRSSGYVIGMLRQSGVVDARGYHISDTEIINLLNDGHPVITD